MDATLMETIVVCGIVVLSGVLLTWHADREIRKGIPGFPYD